MKENKVSLKQREEGFFSSIPTIPTVSFHSNFQWLPPSVHSSMVLPQEEVDEKGDRKMT